MRVSVSRPGADSLPGVHLQLDWVPGADCIPGVFCEDSVPHSAQSLEEPDLHVYEAYLQWTVPEATPLMKGTMLKAGEFWSVLGPDGLDGYDAPFHALLSRLGVPLTQVGVLGTRQLSSRVAATGGLVRGWDSPGTVHAAAAGTGNIAYTVTDTLLLAASGMWNPAPAGRLGVAKVNAVLYPMPSLTLLLDQSWGTGGASRAQARWRSSALAATYEFRQRWTFEARSEWLGATATAENAVVPRHLWATSLSGVYRIAERLEARLEYRHEAAGAASAAAPNAQHGTPDVVALGVDWLF